MAGNPLLGATPAVPLVGITSNPALTQNTDMTPAVAGMNRHGSLHADNVHGKFYSVAARGNLFLTATLVAGVTVPVNATTLASTAGIVNPTGSGRNIELVALGIASTTIPVALKNMALGFHMNYSQTGGPPTSVTKLTALSSPLGAGTMAPQGYAYTAATLTNTAVLGPLLWIFGGLETAVGYAQTWFRFDGEVVFGPDTAMAIVNGTAALAGQQVSYLWAEWPI